MPFLWVMSLYLQCPIYAAYTVYSGPKKTFHTSYLESGIITDSHYSFLLEFTRFLC